MMPLSPLVMVLGEQVLSLLTGVGDLTFWCSAISFKACTAYLTRRNASCRTGLSNTDLGLGKGQRSNQSLQVKQFVLVPATPSQTRRMRSNRRY